MAITYAVVNAKGGVGKTTTAFNFGAALTHAGKRTLLVDNDPQKANLTLAMGHVSQGMQNTMASLYCTALDNPDALAEHVARTIIHGEEVDLLPANKKLAGISTRLSIEQVSSLSGTDGIAPERALKEILKTVQNDYDYIIIDCGPELTMLMTEAVVAADQLIIPVQAQYLSAEGIPDAMETFRFIRSRYNPSLSVGGILLTMCQTRTNLCKGIQAQVSEQYGAECRIFRQPVAWSVRVAEHPAYGESLFRFDPTHDATLAYASMAEEVIAHA